jgi:hypothetical protein
MDEPHTRFGEMSPLFSTRNPAIGFYFAFAVLLRDATISSDLNWEPVLRGNVTRLNTMRCDAESILVSAKSFVFYCMCFCLCREDGPC